MNKLYKKIANALIVLYTLVLIAVIAGIWMWHTAKKDAEMMESYEWIHNSRCLEKIKSSAVSNSPFAFAVLGDIQSGAANLPRVMQAIRAEMPGAFIVQTGDAVSHADPGHYNVFLSELAHSGLWLPMFVVPGNHDVRSDPEMLFARYFGSGHLWFKYREALFILLDNSLGSLDASQYQWLESVLEKHARTAKHIFLFMHRQPIHWQGDGKNNDESQYARLFELNRAYSVDYVFSGHWHGYHREERDETIFVVNGRSGDFDHDDLLVSSHFTIVEVGGDSVRDRHVELPPSASILFRSQMKDWLVTSIGEPVIKNRWITFCVLSVIGVGCILFLILSRSADSSGRVICRAHKNRNAGDSPDVYPHEENSTGPTKGPS